MSESSAVFFITGTDTDAGKTYISCGILEAAHKSGLSVAAIKPLAAGGIATEQGVCNDDALALQALCKPPLSYGEVNPVCLNEAVAPHIAAQREGRTITARSLAEACSPVLAQQADITVIEGIGGWKVPLNETECASDLVSELSIPVILVVAMRLGCINHALLTVESIERDGMYLAGWIANQVQAEMDSYNENVATLQSRIKAPLLAEIKHQEYFSLSSSCAAEINIGDILKSLRP